MRSANLLGAVAALGVLSMPPSAAAQGRELRRTEPVTLVAELTGAFALAGATYLVTPPEECSWCEPPSFDEALHAPAEPFNRVQAARVSHLFSTYLLPTAALGFGVVTPLVTSAPDGHAAENAAILAETVFFDIALTLAVKSWAGRRRPAFHYGRGQYTEYVDEPREQNVSFFSGDSSVAFATASASATLSFLRGYASAPYVAAVGGVVAGSTALLRVRADVHWPSDVLVGSLVGIAVGVAMPLLLHGREDAVAGTENAALARPGPTPLAFGWTGAF